MNNQKKLLVPSIEKHNNFNNLKVSAYFLILIQSTDSTGIQTRNKILHVYNQQSILLIQPPLAITAYFGYFILI